MWSWGITKLRGPDKGNWYHLYVLIGIYSRHVVGWTVASREDSPLAEELIRSAIDANAVVPHTVHADRGTSMTSKPVAQLLTDLGVTRSHSRPKVSNDNPYSEAHVRTIKYSGDFPDRFGSSSTPATGAMVYSPTTTTNTGTRRSACTPRPASTSGQPTSSANSGRHPRPGVCGAS